MASRMGPASPLAPLVAPRPHSTQGVPPIRSSEPNRKPWISSSRMTMVTRLNRSTWSSMVVSGRGLPALRRTCDSSSNSAGLREAESRISTSMARHSVAGGPCDESRGFPRPRPARSKAARKLAARALRHRPYQPIHPVSSDDSYVCWRGAGDQRWARAGGAAVAGSEHFDAVVGGSVTALRFAEAGLSVCVLERGKRYGPGDFPTTPRLMARNFWDPSAGLQGMFDVWAFRHLEAVVCAGLGGGSLIYANVLLRKD